MTRRIVHLATYLQGGAGRAIADLACAQRAAGHDVLVVTSAAPRGPFANYPHYLDQLARAGVACRLEDSLFVRDTALTGRVAARIAAALRPGDDVLLHAHAGVPARVALAVAAARRQPAPVLQTQHGWGTNKSAAQAREDLDTLARMDAVLVTSAATGRQLEAMGVPAALVTVVPCGLPPIAPPASRAAREQAAALRARGWLVLGCVGSVTANKNQQLVVRAVARRTRPLAAVVVGEGGQALAGLCDELGVADRVCLAGYQPDADAWLTAFDALVLPSLTEGQGLVVLEAFRAGVPVVASDIAPLRELVVEGRTGWRFDPGDPDSLVEAVTRAAAATAAERRRITTAARALFERSYTTEAMVRGHDVVYDRAFAGRLAPAAISEL